MSGEVTQGHQSNTRCDGSSVSKGEVGTSVVGLEDIVLGDVVEEDVAVEKLFAAVLQGEEAVCPL